MMHIARRLITIIQTEGFSGVMQRIHCRIAKFRLKAGKLTNRPQVKSVYGLNLKANYDDRTFTFYVTGAYGFFYSSLLHTIDSKFYFIDIGANQGLYSMIAAKNKHCERVVAFEPVRRTADLCAANFSINKVQDKITLVKKAISDKTGNAEMSVNRHHSGRASIAQTNTNTFTDIENIEVVNHEGLNELHLDPSVPVYIKIDVEGHEEIVLKELFLSRIAGQIQQIYYECDEKWISPESVEEWLKQKGFSINKMGQEEHYNVLATRQGDRID